MRGTFSRDPAQPSAARCHVMPPPNSKKVIVQIRTVDSEDYLARPAVRAAAKVDPASYFEGLRAAAELAQAQRACQFKLIDRTKRSSLHTHCEVVRTDGVKLLVTEELMRCFYDLSVPQAREILGVPERTLRRLREWCGVTRWPRACMLTKTHPTYTFRRVREHRHAMMLRAQADDPFVYGLLYEAHKLGHCDVSAMPLPPCLALRRHPVAVPRKAPRVKQQATVREEYLAQPAFNEDCITEDLLDLECFKSGCGGAQAPPAAAEEAIVASQGGRDDYYDCARDYDDCCQPSSCDLEGFLMSGMDVY